MASGKPVVRQVAWISMIPQLAVIIILIVVCSMLIRPYELASCIAMVIYLSASLLLRNLIPHNHRSGMRLVRSGNYEQAISEYEKSYAFFSEHEWIDKYRFITLLSSGRMTYKEMALVNIAYCYTQIGDGRRAKEYYEKTLQQFPDSEMAKSALRMLNSVSNAENSAE